MATTEYALVTVAAAAFAGVLITLVKSQPVRDLLDGHHPHRAWAMIARPGRGGHFRGCPGRRSPLCATARRDSGPAARRDAGSVSVEFALALPAVVVLVAFALGCVRGHRRGRRSRRGGHRGPGCPGGWCGGRGRSRSRHRTRVAGALRPGGAVVGDSGSGPRARAVSRRRRHRPCVPAVTRLRRIRRVVKADRGSASVVVACLVGIVVVVAVAAAAAGGLALQRAHARAGADLAALAGAAAARERVEGRVGVEPCAAARSTAEANAVAVTACVPARDGTVWVEVSAGRATARARAGPLWTN